MNEITRRAVAITVIVAVVIATVLVAAQVATVAGRVTGQWIATLFEEDGPLFDCRINGNDVCGPGNSQGVEPGCYVHGRLVAGFREGAQVPCVPLPPR